MSHPTCSGIFQNAHDLLVALLRETVTSSFLSYIYATDGSHGPFCAPQDWCRDRAVSPSALLLLSTGLRYQTYPGMYGKSTCHICCAIGTDLVLCCVLCRDGFGGDFAGRMVVSWSVGGLLQWVNSPQTLTHHQQTSQGLSSIALHYSPEQYLGVSVIPCLSLPIRALLFGWCSGCNDDALHGFALCNGMAVTHRLISQSSGKSLSFPDRLWMATVISWSALDGHCYFYFLLGSGWSLLFPGGPWMVTVISLWAPSGHCSFWLRLGWVLLCHAGL